MDDAAPESGRARSMKSGRRGAAARPSGGAMLPPQSIGVAADRDRLWIRRPFLNHQGQFEKYIVHGHSPTNRGKSRLVRPDVRPNRCNVDTGAVYGGNLSAAVFHDSQAEPLFTMCMPLGLPYEPLRNTSLDAPPKSITLYGHALLNPKTNGLARWSRPASSVFIP